MMADLSDTTFQPLTGTRSGSGQFLRGFVGSAVLLLMIDAAEPILFGEGHFAEMAYHPFWIVILLAAVQHGVFVGLSVVGLATMMMDWPARPIGVDITEHYLDVASAPALWLIAALLIGLYRQRQIRQERALDAENARMREINRTLADEIHRLDAFVARAELAAATRDLQSTEDGPDDRFAALDRLAAADVEGRQPAFIDASRACLQEPVAWLKLDEMGKLAMAAVSDDSATFPEIVLSDLPPDTMGKGLAIAAVDGECAGLRLPFCRLAPDGEPEGVLLALPGDRDASEIKPGLNALGRALEHSLRRVPDTTPSDVRELVSAYA